MAKIQMIRCTVCDSEFQPSCEDAQLHFCITCGQPNVAGDQSVQTLTPQNAPKVKPEEPLRRLSIRALIDGHSQLYVGNHQVFWVHKVGRPPGLPGDQNQPTYLNGEPWLPSWTGAARTSGLLALDLENPKLNLALPADGAQLMTELTMGRGVVTALWLGQGILVSFNDPRPGADWYELQVHW